MLATLVLGGCFFHADVPVQTPQQPPAAEDPPDKSLIRGPQTTSAAKDQTAAGDNDKSAAARALLLRGGWYRTALTTEESATAIYGEAASQAAKAAPVANSYRYRHAGLEQLMVGPAARRGELPGLLGDQDRLVASTAAIALAREGNPKAAPRLIAAIEDDQLPLPARGAAVEALGQLPGDAQVESLCRLADCYGQYVPGASAGYQADLHAELLRALVRHVEAADDPRFTAAAASPSSLVRIETLRAWAAGKRGLMPMSIIDLRSDDDPRVRAAALKALAARKPADARDYLTTALKDVDLAVRLAAIRGLGELEDGKSRAILTDLLKDRSELIRAEAVATIAAHGSQAVVLGAASDSAWRVRLKVAEALAGYNDADAVATARRMLGDPSAEVERQVVRSLAAWPLETAAPVLLEALGRDAISVRKLAADQLAARWKGSERFPYEAPPDRRAQALAELRQRLQREFGDSAAQGARSTGFSLKSENSSAKAATTTVSASDGLVEKLVADGDFATLARLGPTVVGSLERLAIERQLTLPEPIYQDVLPRYSTAFAALDRLARSKADQRQRAAEELVGLAKKQPVGRLAVARLCELMTTETDAAVWLRALDVVGDDGGEPAVRMARLALSQTAGEVRRRACEFLAVHPNPGHEVFLTPLLADPEQAVVVAAIRALGAAGRIADLGPLKKSLASTDAEVQLEVALVLVRLRDPAGDEAIQRLSYASDIKLRGRLARALGDLGDARFTAILVRMLDDPRATVSHAALASLPRVVGHDVAQSNDGVAVSTAEQIERWKKWYAEAKP